MERQNASGRGKERNNTLWKTRQERCIDGEGLFGKRKKLNRKRKKENWKAC